MKKIYCIAIAGILAGCTIDLKDINTSIVLAETESEMTVEVRVGGEIISTKSDATAAEKEVEDFDLLVFNVTSEGNFLEYADFALKPQEAVAVKGSKDVSIWQDKLVLPTSGTKRVIAVGNGSKAVYPDMELGKTTYEEFCKAFSFKAIDSNSGQTPLVMTGSTLVASASASHVFVKLARQYNKFDIQNKADGLSVSSVQIVNAPAEAWPFVGDFNSIEPAFMEYPALSTIGRKASELVKDELYILYTPGGKIEEYNVKVFVKGELNGADYRNVFVCRLPMYCDYNTTMTLSLEGNSVVASYTPDYDSFQSNVTPIPETIASWPWTGLKSGNEYAAQWLDQRPVASGNALFQFVQADSNKADFPLTYSTGTASQLKNRLRVANGFTGDYFLWSFTLDEVKKGGTLSFLNGFVSATQWGPKYFILQYSFDGTEWKDARKTITAKSESGSGRDVTYSIAVPRQDTPESLDFNVVLSETVKGGNFYVRLLIADSCRSVAANGDIAAGDGKSAGITYIHVDNDRVLDKNTFYDDDWAYIKLSYTTPEE